MLIEFSVSNFRSFRERQTLSMVAAPGLGKEGNVFAAPVDGEELPDLLKVAAVNRVLGPWTKWQYSNRSLMALIPESAADVVAFLNETDIPVAAIRSSQLGAQLGFASDSENRTTLRHETARGEADFDFEEESDGTKNLIGLALPWMLLHENHIEIHTILAIDEFDSSLHPDIVATIVCKHIESEIPRQLRSVHDFEGSENEDLEKRYFEGRYRALPLVRRD